MYKYGHMPFVRLVFPLIFGIITATFFFQNQLVYLILLLGALLGLLIVNVLSKGKISQSIFATSGSFVYLITFSLGAFISSHYIEIDNKLHFSNLKNARFLLAEVIEAPVEKRKSDKTIIIIKAAQDSLGNWQNTSGKLLLYTEKNDSTRSLQQGDEIILPNKISTLREPSNPGEFNYKRYLSFKYIHHQAYFKNNEYTIRKNDKKTLWNFAQGLRKRMQSVLINNGLTDNNLAVASALLLGEKGLLDPEIHQAYAAAGAMHVLAVSGLHVGIIYLILNHIFSLIFRSKNSPSKTIIIVIVLWLYAMITGLSPSVVRAATMFSAISIGRLMNNKQNIYNTLASSAFVLLLFKPNFLFEVGFQLSYLAVIGIIYLHPKIYHLFHFSNGILDKVWSLTAVSISAQLATFPLGVLYFHIFPSYFFLSNLVVIPAAVIIMYFGISLFVFSFYEPIANWISTELIGIINALNHFVAWIQNLPNAVIENIHFSVLDTWMLYLVILFGSLFLIKKRVKHLILCLASIFIIISARSYDFFSFKNNHFLCVYDISKSSAINFISQDYNYMIDVGKLNVDLNSNPFQMKNNWIRHGYGNCIKVDPAEFSDKNYKSIGEKIWGAFGQKIAVINEVQTVKFPEPIPIDILLISKSKGMKIQAILDNYLPKEIILDSSFTPYYANKFKDEIPTDIICHATSLEGGYEKRLN